MTLLRLISYLCYEHGRFSFVCVVCHHAHLVTGNVHQVRWPLTVVLLPGAALLLIDGVAFDLGEAQKATDHGKVLPECPVLGGRIFLPAQQLTEPALTEGDRGGEKTKSKSAQPGFYPQLWAQDKRIWTPVNIS